MHHAPVRSDHLRVDITWGAGCLVLHLRQGLTATLFHCPVKDASRSAVWLCRGQSAAPGTHMLVHRTEKPQVLLAENRYRSQGAVTQQALLGCGRSHIEGWHDGPLVKPVPVMLASQMGAASTSDPAPCVRVLV